jgi:hypothetical protein
MILALLLSLRKQTYICDLNFIFIWSAVSSFATFFFCAGGLPGEFNPIFILYSAAYLVKIIQLMINQPKIPTSGLYQRV